MIEIPVRGFFLAKKGKYAMMIYIMSVKQEFPVSNAGLLS